MGVVPAIATALGAEPVKKIKAARIRIEEKMAI